MKFRTLFVLLPLILLSSKFFIGCSGKDVDQNNPQAMLDDAEEDVRDKRYQMALEKLKTIKNKFPYSALSTTAALRVADVQDLDESYVEAAAAYEVFRDLHPKHEKADYVIFRIGESYFNQLPSTIDRDLTPASKAIASYSELQQVWPTSAFGSQAKEHQTECSELLSQKEKYIADFYYKREMYDSASKRYEKIATKFAGTNNAQISYLRWGLSLLEQSKDPVYAEKKDALIGEAKHVFKTYLSQYPTGQYVAEVNKARRINDLND